MSPWRVGGLVLSWLILWLTFDALYQRQSGEWLVQAHLNARFTERDTLARALDHYPKVRPPLYPLLLRGWTRAGLPLPRFNQLLFAAALLLVAVYFKAHVPEVHPLWPAAFLALAHFDLFNLYQPTAESLVLPLNLLLVLLLVRHQRAPGTASAVAIGLCVAAQLTARYSGLFFALPLALAHTFTAPGERARRLWHTALVAVAGTLPLALWMTRAYLATGYWTGADRSFARHMPEAVAYWRELAGFWGSARLVPKTIFIDFFSLRQGASLAVVTQPYSTNLVELALALAAASLALMAARSAARATSDALRAPWAVSGQLLALYLLGTPVVWGLGNNDPVHSRFLWPVYPMIVLLAGHAAAVLRTSRPARAMLLGLWVALLLVHARRSAEAKPVPVRYDLGETGADDAGRD